MPRIAATLGVFGLVLLALGLNMAQFPIKYGNTVPVVGSAKPEPKPETASVHSEFEPVAPPKPASTEPTADSSKQKPTEETSEQQEQSPTSPSMPYRLPPASLPPADYAGDCNLAASPDFQSFATQSEPGEDTQNESEEPDNTAELNQYEFAQESYAAPESESEVTVVPEYTPSLSENTTQPETAFSPANPVGIYNPLKPRREVDGELPAATAPTVRETLDSPTEAIPNPAYATDPSLRTAEPDLLPTDTASADTLTRNGVIRLPPVDDAPPIDSTAASTTPSSNQEPSSDKTWPGEPASQSLPLKWFPSEGYSKPEDLQ